MPNSEHALRDAPRAGLPTKALEALLASIVFALAPELLFGSGAALDPHPGFIAVLLLAARYGRDGFFAGLAGTALCAELGSGLRSGDITTLWTRLDSTPSLISLCACVLVSWVASGHLRKKAELEARAAELGKRTSDAEAVTAGLHDAVLRLRARIDRASVSLSFLRDVAERLVGADPRTAAEAAAELALVRTGAAAAAVKVGSGAFERLLAIRDARGVLPPASPNDRRVDLCIPIELAQGRVGDLILCDIPSASLSDATMHDLAVIAAWVAPSLARTAWGRETVPAAVLELS